jgi:protein-L-isoaspartate(D-aspartate) O-methyltransferase
MGRSQDLVEAARRAGVTNARVLDAIARVPRADFVPPDLRGRAYVDGPLPIPHGQVTTQPSLVARMLEGLGLSGGERVLEVGSGYGWQTALLAKLAAEVFGVERFSDLAASATSNLRAAGIEGWQLVVGDGSAGLPEHAPYDAILVSAAHPRVPEPLVGQLSEGGRLVQPIGRGGNEHVFAFERVGGALVERQLLSAAHFVQLVGRHGFAAREDEAP